MPASPSSATTCRSGSARRSGRSVPTEWVLLDIRIHAVAHGFGHGAVHLWAEDGTLLATASQSTIIRMMDAEMAARMAEMVLGDGAPGN